jgi:hypothetical protein
MAMPLLVKASRGENVVLPVKKYCFKQATAFREFRRVIIKMSRDYG